MIEIPFCSVKTQYQSDQSYVYKSQFKKRSPMQAYWIDEFTCDRSFCKQVQSNQAILVI